MYACTSMMHVLYAYLHTAYNINAKHGNNMVLGIQIATHSYFVSNYSC